MNVEHGFLTGLLAILDLTLGARQILAAAFDDA
jgi:hypothetical protein